MKARVLRTRLGVRVAPFVLLLGTAHANPNDTVQFTAGYSIQHDDNLFRLQNKRDASALVGRDTPAETIRTATAGLRFAKEYGLQRIKLDASAVNYDYQNFSYLGFTGFNYDGLLNWQLTPRFRGTVTGRREEALNTFGDFRIFTLRNERTVITTAAEGLYELDGAWQLAAGLSRLELQNSATVIEQRAFSRNSVEAGFQRSYSSGSLLSYRLRKGTGEYSTVSFASGLFLPSNYDETENELRLNWALTAKTQLDTRISYLQKKFNQFNFRDYDGVTASSTLNWGITSRTDLQVGVSRDLGDFQTVTSNFSTNDRVSIAPRWRIKEKLSLSLRHEHIRRRLSGDVPGSTATQQRVDTQTSTRLSLDWTPREFVNLSTWLQRDSRDSNFSGLGFTSNSAGVRALVSF